MVLMSTKGTIAYPMGRTMLVQLMVVVVGAISQASAQLSCPVEWTLYGDGCYRIYTKLLSWQGALDVCRFDGAYLSRIGDIYTNDYIGNLARSASISQFWIGLNRISVSDANKIYSQWSDGSPSSVYQAFWSELQPNVSAAAGKCVYIFIVKDKNRWSFGPCEWKRAFVCEMPACPTDNFHCSSGDCVQSGRICDGVEDCADGSDEISCSSRCKTYTRETSGSVVSTNFPGAYPALSDCQWTLEGPLESNIILQVNSLDTQTEVDEVIIFGGGKTSYTSYILARISGTNSSTVNLRSFNNFMIVRFISDSVTQGKGFNLTWSALNTGIADAGVFVPASAFKQELLSQFYPRPYLSNQETLWIIYAPPRSIITLTRIDTDLAAADYIYVRDGADAGAPLLAQYMGTNGPLHIFSTQKYLYILMKTGSNKAANKGFRFSYRTGCNVMLTASTGEIFSPGYGVVHYADYTTCVYVISPTNAQTTTLIFDRNYDVDYQYDHLQVFRGSSASDNPVHNIANDGFTGSVAPGPIISNNGKIYVRFITNAIGRRAGWKAIYSSSCPVVQFNADTIVTPPNPDFYYGVAFNVTCPNGFVFDALEFYTRLSDGSMTSKTVVHMECLIGGVWNVQRYPQCVRRYCGQAPKIANGYVQYSTGVVYGSTATYVCAAGYNGSATITCQQNGTWQAAPVCTGVNCSLRSMGINYGTVKLFTGDGFSAGTVYSYNCSIGYMLRGSPLVSCNTTGIWSHSSPTCTKVQCLVPTLTHGTINAGGQMFVDYNATLAVSCSTPGYTLVGSATITCQHNMTFTALPICQDVNECASNPCPPTAQCLNTDGSYRCTCWPGFTASGADCVDISECAVYNGGCSDICRELNGSYACDCRLGSVLYTQNGTMGFIIPPTETGLRYNDTYFINHTCVRKQCPMPPSVTYGYLTDRRKQYNYGDTITVNCLQDYVLNGVVTLTCQSNGTWSSDFPSCEIAMCPQDTIPGNLRNPPWLVDPPAPGRVKVNKRLNISCIVPGIGTFNKTRTCRFDPGLQLYRLQGDSYECGVVDCGKPLLPAGGIAFPAPNTTTFGSTFNLYCDYEYTLEGSNNLGTNIITCAGNSYWTFFNITCIRRQCPYPGVPAGGQVNFGSSSFNYNDNVTFTCLRSGFQPTNNTARCGVSENGQSLSWSIDNPVSCVDVEPPTFSNCPNRSVSVTLYSQAGFTIPTFQDNSGSVASIAVSPAYFHPTQPVGQDTRVTYTVTDHAGFSANCTISVTVRDITPPKVQCPSEQIVYKSINDTAYALYNPTASMVVYNSSDANLTFSASALLNFSYAEVGKVVNVTATVRDSSSNTASCQFQVVVQAMKCQQNSLSSVNMQQQCSKTGTGGYNCTFTCNMGYYFYDTYTSETFVTTCEPGQDYKPYYIPSCVESDRVQLLVEESINYAASPAESLTSSCQLQYSNNLIPVLRGLSSTFRKICINQTLVADISYTESSFGTGYNVTSQQMAVRFRMLLTTQDSSRTAELQLLQCYAALSANFEALINNTGDLLVLKTVTLIGCPNVTAFHQNHSSNWICVDSSLKLRDPSGSQFSVCLPCPKGTSKNALGNCEPCSLGTYWVPVASQQNGQCLQCPNGKSTASIGSIGLAACVDTCGGNFVSVNGVPPCRECTGNSFALNSSYCQMCPNNTLAPRKESPLDPNCLNPEACYCAAKCTPGYYSVTGYANCLPCPVGYYTDTDGSTNCNECPSGQTTLAVNSSMCVIASVMCQPNPCLNGGVCSTPLHEAFCTCLPGFSGRYCDIAANLCTSSPCYNNGTCVSNASGFSCSCPSGFRGSQCEENINDCPVNACTGRGTCIDGVNSYTCDCVDNFSGTFCQTKQKNGCDIFPCGANSTCRPTNDYHRVCDCFPGFTGPLCDREINECESQPCINGGTCHDLINGFICSCRANFTGTQCELPVQSCNMAQCGTFDNCKNDPLTGLPICICSYGYSQGRLCQYSITTDKDISVGTQNQTVNIEAPQCRSLCDLKGAVCVAFVYEVGSKTCKIYSEVTSTSSYSPSSGLKIVSFKRCSHPTDNYFYTEWFNSNNADISGIDTESYNLINGYGMTVCENTLPVGVECRVVSTNGSIPAGVTCDLSGLACSVSNGSAAFPDMEIRYRCARSRVYAGKQCQVKDVCGEVTSPCISGTCVNKPDDLKGYHCVSCSPGFTGDSCQLTTDECAGQPCQNGGTCNDLSIAYNCTCVPGYTGLNCQVNPDNCACNPVGTKNCLDGLNDYTCNCLPGYTGHNCSVNINECASNPCFSDAKCVDQVNGFTCGCLPGWTGNLCESILDLCRLPISAACSSNGGTCEMLFNDYSCRCSSETFGRNCELVPGYGQCTNNNPCIDRSNCQVVNVTTATCYCTQADKIGLGCELYASYTCDNTRCQNGGTCFVTSTGPSCTCLAGYTGSNCETNSNECATVTCSGQNAQCIDGVNEAFCRCPVGKASPNCLTDINENYDLCFSPSPGTAGAALPYSLAAANLRGFTIIVWVRYSHPGASGNFLTVYSTSSSSLTNTEKHILRMNETGLEVTLFGGSRTLTFDLFPINDGLWHLVVLFWSSATGDLDLTVDFMRQNRLRSYGFVPINYNWWFVLGGNKNSPTPSAKSFEGCLYGINFLSRGLDFTTDLPALQTQPGRYQGDLLRWAEFKLYGNVKVVRPSMARLVNCNTNPSLPACTVQIRDSEAPKVLSCPSDIILDTIYQDAFASWTPPVFSGSVSQTASHQPGALFQRGSTEVVYTATDQASNTVICSFTVFVGASTRCPDLSPPRGGGTQVCQRSNSTFDACSGFCPESTAKFVDDVPVYYTCDPGGSWETLQDDEGLYPTCGRVSGPARAEVAVHLAYRINSGECSTISRSLITQGRADMATLLRTWGGDLCRRTNCSDISPVVDCTTLTNTKVDIQLSNVSAVMTSGIGQRSVEDVLTSSVLDNNLLTFMDTFPDINMNKQEYTVKVTYICEAGRVPRGQLCVECGPGTYYNSSTKLCHNCAMGTFMTGYASLACTPCPAGQTTRNIGSTSASDCATICPIGHYFNSSSCVPCNISFYQNQTGQFSCKSCPRGYLTLNTGSTSLTQCSEGCASGNELLPNGTCVACKEGFYRQYGIQQVCLPCPEGYTTLAVASTSADNCTVLRCLVGSRANATLTGCELCHLGEYQPQINQISCVPCPINYTTAQQGSVNASQCQRFCPSGYELKASECVRCPGATYKDNTVNPLSSCVACPPGYITAIDGSTSISACSIRNCTAGFFVQKNSQGVETCALCPVDMYSSQNYQTSCTSCPGGTGTRQPGSDSVNLCQAFCQSGQELMNSTCKSCSLGYYKDNNISRFSVCTLCPEEFITVSTGSPAVSSCSIRNCSAGFYRQVTNNTCIECPLSTYQPDKWQTICLNCPPDRLTEVTRSVNISQCLLNCSLGQEDRQGACVACAMGFYKNRTGAVACSLCPPGFRTQSTGSDDVTDCSIAACDPGSYLHTATNTCQSCPIGQYQPDKWRDSCLLCPSGNTTYVTGAVSVSQCLTNCSLGSELNMTTGSCFLCARGYYRDNIFGACTLCPGNSITASTGALSVSQCVIANCTVPGLYLNINSNTCDPCPTGTYNSIWWAESCTPCPSGFTTKTSGMAAISSCFRDCPSGQQVNEISNMCNACKPGMYRNKAEGTWSCQPCPTPFTTPGDGADSVAACSIPTCGPGLYYNSSQLQCLLCTVGTYQSLSGQRSCDACPVQQTTLSAGSVSISNCISKCAAVQNNYCSPNAACSIGSAGNIICTCNSNYQGNGRTCSHVCDLTVLYCQNGASCIKDRTSACLCTQYYYGEQCEKRSDPSKDVSNVNVIVGVVIGVVVFLLLLVLLVIGIIVRRRRQRIPLDKDTVSTVTNSRPPSVIIPRMNIQSYSRSFTAKSKPSSGYDPAYYNAAESDREVPSVAFENPTFR